jgi:L-malate glycosyltransferase
VAAEEIGVRVARIVERLPPAGADEAVHAARLSEALAAQGVEQQLYFRVGEPVAGAVGHVRAQGKAACRVHARLSFCMATRRALELDHRRRPFDLIHAHGGLLEALAAATLSSRLAVPAVFSVNDDGSDEGGRGTLRRATYSAMQQIISVPRNATAEPAAETVDLYRSILAGYRRPSVVFALPWLDLGGAEYFVLSLARGLSERGARTCVAGAPGHLVTELGEDIEYTQLEPWRSPGGSVRNVLAIAGAATRLRPRAVNSHHFPTGIVARAGTSLARNGSRHVLTIHVTEDPRVAPIVGFVGAFAFDRLLFVAQSVRDECARFAPPWRRERFQVVHAGVDLPPPTERRRKSVGVIARLVERKGHAVLLDAWQRVKQDPAAADWTLELWGEGPERERIEALAEGLDCVVAGAVPRAAERVGEFAIVALPSLREGLPIVLIEAMAAGCAVVASDLPGCRELVGEGAGILVPPGNADALAAALLALTRDPERRAALGRAGRERVAAAFDRRRMLDDYDRALLRPTIE